MENRIDRRLETAIESWPMSSFDSFQTGPDDQGRRVDRIIRRLYPGLPLSMLYRMFRTGSVRLSGKKAKGADLIQAGDQILVRRPPGLEPLPSPVDGEAMVFSRQHDKNCQFFESLILFHTPDLIIVNKPKGLLTHGQNGLDVLTTAYFSNKVPASLSFRPAPLHRLDRNTSGALAISASIHGARAFSAALHTGVIGKEYLALLDGRLENEVLMKDRLSRNGQKRTSAVISGGIGPIAETRLLPLISNESHTLVAIRILTGLTHQIRVQCASQGHPLSGDEKYGGQPLRGGYLLHCFKLELPEDSGAESPIVITAPMPGAFRKIMEAIFDPTSLDSEAFQRYP